MNSRTALKQIRNIMDMPDIVTPEQIAEALEQRGEEVAEIIEEAEKEAIVIENEIALGQNRIFINRLVRLFCTGKYTLNQLSQLVGVDRSTITLWLGQEDVQKAIETYQEIERNLTNAQMNALKASSMDRIKNIIEHGRDDKAAVMAIKEILDRTGHKVDEKKTLNVNISYEQRLAQLREQAIDAQVIENLEQ
jgi:transcriptional regulator with XRE-family HTH domain